MNLHLSQIKKCIIKIVPGPHTPELNSHWNQVLSLAYRIRGSFIPILSSLLYNPQLTLTLYVMETRSTKTWLWLICLSSPASLALRAILTSAPHFNLANESMSLGQRSETWYKSKLPAYMIGEMGLVIFLFWKSLSLNSLSQHITADWQTSEIAKYVRLWVLSFKLKIT